jgi:hypothetical protein
MKIIEHKARDVKSGETVLDRGTRFIIKEVRVSAEHGPIALIDMEGVWHGVYHPDEYLGKSYCSSIDPPRDEVRPNTDISAAVLR